jgi:hypothetical protein
MLICAASGAALSSSKPLSSSVSCLAAGGKTQFLKKGIGTCSLFLVATELAITPHHSGQTYFPRTQPRLALLVMTWHQTLGFFILLYFQLADPPASIRHRVFAPASQADVGAVIIGANNGGV